MFLFSISRVILITFAIVLLVILVIIAILGNRDILYERSIHARINSCNLMKDKNNVMYVAQITHDEIIDSKYLSLRFAKLIIDLTGDRD